MYYVIILRLFNALQNYVFDKTVKKYLIDSTPQVELS